MAQRETTLRALVEEGLRRVVAEAETGRRPVEFRFQGRAGFAPGMDAERALAGIRRDVDGRVGAILTGPDGEP